MQGELSPRAGSGHRPEGASQPWADHVAQRRTEGLCAVSAMGTVAPGAQTACVLLLLRTRALRGGLAKLPRPVGLRDASVPFAASKDRLMPRVKGGGLGRPRKQHPCRLEMRAKSPALPAVTGGGGALAVPGQEARDPPTPRPLEA